MRPGDAGRGSYSWAGQGRGGMICICMAQRPPGLVLAECVRPVRYTNGSPAAAAVRRRTWLLHAAVPPCRARRRPDRGACRECSLGLSVRHSRANGPLNDAIDVGHARSRDAVAALVAAVAPSSPSSASPRPRRALVDGRRARYPARVGQRDRNSSRESAHEMRCGVAGATCQKQAFALRSGRRQSKQAPTPPAMPRCGLAPDAPTAHPPLRLHGSFLGAGTRAVTGLRTEGRCGRMSDPRPHAGGPAAKLG